MIKMIAIVGALAAVGGVVGYLGVFCPDGSCAITGSWYGGATLGGLLGFGVFSCFANPMNSPAASPESDADNEAATREG